MFVLFACVWILPLRGTRAKIFRAKLQQFFDICKFIRTFAENLYMKRILFYIVLAVTLAACQKSQTLEERALELCAYIPDHALLETARNYMTPDFYAVLDTMFHYLPADDVMDRDWLYYFVTGNGGTIPNYEVVKVEQTDKHHAVATIAVRQVWEDGSLAQGSGIEEHRLYMERVNGRWLMSDFDGHKDDCIRYKKKRPESL